MKNILGGKSGACCGSCSRFSHMGTALKLFIALALAFFVYLIGVGMGIAGSRQGAMYGIKSAQNTNITTGFMMNNGNGFFSRSVMMLPGQNRSVRFFGTVAKIEKNQLTILDNAAAEQLVFTQATTVITDDDTEVGLSDLSLGDNVVVYGSPNSDNQIVAGIIEIQQ